jgi:hypothetical protein
MTGWEFLDSFSEFPENIKEHFTVYILSSSIYDRDKEHALSYPVITEYIEKPITKKIADRIFSSISLKRKPLKVSLPF